MIKNYIKIAFRNLLKHKGYTAINISGLAIGIACCLLILIYVQYQLSFDKFHEKADRIVRVSMVTQDQSYAITPSMVAPSLNEVAPEIENWVRLYEPTRYNPVIISYQEEAFHEESFFFADSSFTDIFSFEFIAGDPTTALQDPRSLVLPKSTAEKLFGTTDAVGKVVNARIFNSSYDFQVTGVIKDIPKNSHFTFDYLGSLNTMQSWSQLNDHEVRGANFYTYLLLQNSEMKSSLEQNAEQFVENRLPTERINGLAFTSLSDLYLKSNSELEIQPLGSLQNVIGFAFLAFMILLIAIINYVNLATARSSKRRAEVGVRKSLGAGKAQLIKQFYGESTFLTIISVSVSLVLVELLKSPFFALMGQNIDLNIFTEPSVWILLIGITVITALLAGSYPAFLLSSYQPAKVLKGLYGTKGSDTKLRKGLVIAQFALSTVLILSTVIIYQQTDYILTKDLGFDKDHVLVIPARDSELAPKQDLLKSEILRQPGVVSATYMSNIPGKVFGGYGSQHVPDSEIISTSAGAADSDLLKATGIELLAGEGFPDNPNYSKEQGYVFLINEKLANAHGWSANEAVGKRFNVLGNRVGEVVGVMENFNYQSLKEEVTPLALFINKDMYNYLVVKLSPDNIRSNISSIENVWNEVAPHRPFEFEFMDQQLNALYESEVQTRNLLLVFSGLAIFIACLGLVGLSSFMIERRAKEIGIRKVLGASVAKIVTMLSSDYLKLVITGFFLGMPLAWYLMKEWLNNYPYKIDMGILVFVITGAIAVFLAILTVSWQSIKAAVANPVESLRSE